MSVQQAAETPSDRRDFLAAGLFLAWAAVGWVGLATNRPLRESIGAAPDPGPALMPLIALSVLTIGGVAIGIAGIVRRRARREKTRGNWRSHLIPAAYVATILVATVAMTHVGFLATAMVMSALWLVALSGDPLLSPWNLIRGVLLAILITACVYIVFAYLLHVPLP